jgi:hypothetical protein
MEIRRAAGTMKSIHEIVLDRYMRMRYNTYKYTQTQIFAVKNRLIWHCMTDQPGTMSFGLPMSVGHVKKAGRAISAEGGQLWRKIIIASGVGQSTQVFPA